jgi:hypothetical protein
VQIRKKEEMNGVGCIPGDGPLALTDALSLDPQPELRLRFFKRDGCHRWHPGRNLEVKGKKKEKKGGEKGAQLY